MSACLNPHQRHPVISSTQGYLLCPVPNCGFLLEGAIIERWRVAALLRSGFSADLYLATAMQEYATRPLRVAVKVLRMSAPVPSWQIEQLLALHHPYIHLLQGIGRIQSGDGLYFLSPYEELGSLVRYLRSGKPLPLPFVADIVRQIAEALHYAHKQQVVHGRLKPENCLLAGSATVQVTDFYHTFFGAQESQITSPFFMAPEQLQGLVQGLSQTLPATDQYALAVITYQLLSGKLPFTASHPAAILAQQTHNLLRPLSSLRPDLPSSVDDTLKRALSKEIDARFQPCTSTQPRRL